MTPGPYAFLEQLRRRAGTRPARIGFPEIEDSRTRNAIARLHSEGLAEPVAVGHRGRFDTPDWGGALAEIERSVVREGRSALDTAAALLADGQLDGVVAGAVHTTGDVIRAGLRHVGIAPDVRTVSSAFYMALDRPSPAGDTVLTFTDAGVVPSPTPEQLAESAWLACEARRRIVGDEPRVAFLSYSTAGSAEGPAIDPVREAVARFRERAPDTESFGEAQADAALVPAIGRRKAPGGGAAGNANVLVFPDLNAANIAYKLVERLAGARALGPILQGLRAPLNDLSRGADPDDIVFVACITSLMARETAE